MSAPSTPKDGKKDQAKKHKDELFDQKTPGTVIQFKKKDSQKVEEEVMLNERGKDHKPQAVEQEYLAGYKVRWCLHLWVFYIDIFFNIIYLPVGKCGA